MCHTLSQKEQPALRNDVTDRMSPPPLPAYICFMISDHKVNKQLYDVSESFQLRNKSGGKEIARHKYRPLIQQITRADFISIF